ncbi:tetratricopeptide repeat protein [Thiolinea disciformis]|uniref:tetratricopeptide repeat protein n=1 Tax=Thiolinea disciformis TaxID=125614 RepID=UPI00036DC66B|nr:tetratricopeptide repeat protein [Thiolinea disciformis]
MPIPRIAQPNNWIHRVAEDEFVALLADKKPYVLPLIGVGGAGKTSLLRRFFAYCDKHSIPALYIDLPHLTVATALDMWLGLEAVHVEYFEEKRKKLHSTYESFSNLLQVYGDDASNAADLLQKHVDEHYGLVFDTVKGAGKAVYDFWQRAENKQHQSLLKQPEEKLIRALAEDFAQGGVILVDTLEQSAQKSLPTRLQFMDDGELRTPVTENAQPMPWLAYCAGLAHFLLDKPVIFTFAGRPPALRELGQLPASYFAPTIQVPAFTAAEIQQYLEASLPRHIRSPETNDIQRLQQLTVGNPFLLDRVLRLMVDWQPTWDWQAAQWQPLLNSYQSDERHGLLLYVTQRLLTHVLPDDRVFWRLALPRQSVQREMAVLLFPTEELGAIAGLARLRVYEEKGLVYREQNPDLYFLHDETRAALEAWAKREGVWLDSVSAALHGRLAKWIKEKTDWEHLQAKLENWAREKDSPLPEFDNPLLLEGAYHSIKADQAFEQRYTGHDREAFWLGLGSLLTFNNAQKMRVANNVSELTLAGATLYKKFFYIIKKRIRKLYSFEMQQWLETESFAGRLPTDWENNETFFTTALKVFPKEPTLLGNFAYFLWQIRHDYGRAESLYQQAIEADPKHADHLGNFATFLWEICHDYDHAETLYQQAIETDPQHTNHLGNFANFLSHIRHDYDRAEILYQQAIESYPKLANHLGNFANFLWKIRHDYDRAQALYQQAIKVNPNDPYPYANYAQLKLIKGDYTQGKTLLEQAFDNKPEDPSLQLELWFYCLAHFPHDYLQAEAEILRLLANGERSTGWDLSGNIAQAKRDGHPHIERLQALANRISA